jgi:hypothetical protein
MTPSEAKEAIDNADEVYVHAFIDGGGDFGSARFPTTKKAARKALRDFVKYSSDEHLYAGSYQRKDKKGRKVDGFHMGVQY